jgi:GxxExxY protein
MRKGNGNAEVAEEKGGLGGPAAANQITERIIGAAMRVHTALGPGLLESAYEACLAYELAHAGLAVERQRKLPITYGDLKLEEGYRIDLLVENTVVVELKAVEQLRDVHEAQLLSYLRLSSCPVGLLINFHVPHLREGIRRVINTRR